MDNLTKYEKARVVGARALQIAMGAPLLLKFSKKDLEDLKFNPVNIAKLELEKDILPLTIKRPLPDMDKENEEVAEEAA